MLAAAVRLRPTPSPPTWTAQNPENGHAHIAYALSAPVAKSDAARLKPLRLLARI
ncbi:replication initiation protein, partial [Escherichia coli]|uniref:replication initiation protein n=2 Tax=Enterobacteriaceae TaxID=543 RepID=UPI000FF1D3E7